MDKNLFTQMRIETDRLTIRPVTMSDLDSFHRIVSQEEVMKFLPEDVMSREELEGILTWLIDCYEKNTPEKIIKFTVAIVLRSVDELVGWCGLGPVDFDESKIEIYYGMSKEHWDKGYATEALRQMLAFGFRNLDLERIVALVDPENVASIRVLEKIGLVYRKTLAKLHPSFEFYEGSLYYDLYAEEYRKLVREDQPSA